MLSVIVLVGYGLCAFSGNPALITLALIAAIPILRIGQLILFKKYITAPLYDQLDVPLYQEIVKQGKMYVPSAFWQLPGEYYAGNYETVIGICNQKINDPKIAKKYKYYYYIYLANVYFDVGNEEKLAEICEIYEKSLAAEKPRKRKKILRGSPRIQFFQNYLKGDFDACYAHAHKPKALKLDQVCYTYYKARIAMQTKATDEAKSLFLSVLQTSETLNYAKLSQHGLDALESEVPYADTFDELVPAEEVVIPAPPRAAKTLRVIRIVTAIALLACILFYIGIIIALRTYENVQKQQSEKEYAEYLESLRILVEEEFDGVEMTEAFNLTKDDQVVDTLFLCKTDRSIVLGCVYINLDDGERYYDVQYELPFSQLEKPYSPLMYVGFPCVTSQYYVHGYFYASESEIPAEYCHLSAIQVEDQTVYFVITEVTEQPSLE